MSDVPAPRSIRRRFGSHVRSNVVGYLALFFALGGTAGATTVMITSQAQMGTNTVNSRVIADHSVGTIDLAAPEAWHVVGAAGQPSWTIVGCGEAYSCEFKNMANGATQFYKDPYGVVHVRINACYSQRFTVSPAGTGTCFNAFDLSNGSRKLFTLPTGYRPSNNLMFEANEYAGKGNANELLIGSGGSVIIVSCNDCIYKARIYNTEFSFRSA